MIVPPNGQPLPLSDTVPETSATYANDFIEIFNRGATTVNFSITPYSVQYAAAASNFTTNKTDITSGILLPGHYFLIQEASGGATGVALPTPDATGTIAMAATAGKVALVSGTTALTGSEIGRASCRERVSSVV